MVRERILASEKYEVLSTFSPNFVLIISGFLGGAIVALALAPLAVKGIPLFQNGDGTERVVILLLATLSLLGAIAAKLLQWEYKINREAYKRVAELHILLVYPFFFLSLLVPGVILWLKAASKGPNITLWVVVLAIALGSAILSPALGVIWRFWHVFWLSILSPVDWRAVVEEQNFNRHLKMSFAEVKRYSSPLSLTIIDIDQSDRLKSRVVRKVRGKLTSIIDKNVRESDAVGRTEGGNVIVTMAHTGSSGASVQAKRVKDILKEHLKSLGTKGKRITVSVGIASYTPDMASYKDLIKKAQVALLRAKEEGGDRLFIE